MTIQYKISKIIESKRLRFFLINKKNKNFNLIKKDIINSTEFLPQTTILAQRMWHILNEIIEIPVCPECGNPVGFKGFGKGGYAEFCSSYCSNHSELNNIKRKNTSIKKFGAENVSQTHYFKEKYKETINKKYGVDHYSKTNEYKIKVKSTMNERYGVDNIMQNKEFVENFFRKYEEKTGFKTPLNNPEVRDKINETLEQVYGVDHNLKIPKIIEDRKNTWLKNYGVDHPMKNIHIFYKVFFSSVLQYKDYIFPSGRIEKIQGYEDKAINELLEEGFTEDDIVICDKEMEKYIGEIFYMYENNMHRYYSDIFVKSLNRIIEVKSVYTFEKDKMKNLAKEKAIKNAGFDFEFKIYER
jgi:hypothetical protein